MPAELREQFDCLSKTQGCKKVSSLCAIQEDLYEIKDEPISEVITGFVYVFPEFDVVIIPKYFLKPFVFRIVLLQMYN